MRHFLLVASDPSTVGALAGRVTESSAAALLVAAAGTAHRLTARLSGASSEAIDVAPITPLADPHLPAASGTIVESVPFRHPTPSTERAGQMAGGKATLGD